MLVSATINVRHERQHHATFQRNSHNSQRHDRSSAIRHSSFTDSRSLKLRRSQSLCQARSTAEAKISKDTSSTKLSIEVLIVASERISEFGPSWFEIMKHISQKLKWSNEQFITSVLLPKDAKQHLSKVTPDIVLFIGLTDTDLDPTLIPTVAIKSPPVVLSFSCSSPQLDNVISLNGYNPMMQSVKRQLQLLLPWSAVRKADGIYKALLQVWSRYTSDDIVYLIQYATHQFITPLSEMTDLDPDFKAIQCIAKNCRNEVIQCLLDPDCRKALDCIQSCGINDQVCSYRCIVSYESELLESFSLCILQKHNCLRNMASIPLLPEVHPMKIFRNEAMTFETAEEIFIGHLADVHWSWRVAFGKNPAYDYFPCQFQLFYRGKSRASMWYDPVFKVITLDGRSVWRRRHYRVRRAKEPGSFYFSVLDNGVTSNEFWRIVDADDELNWALFYYSGAAAAAGIAYTGAVLGTLDGRLPSEAQMPRVQAALERCGIKMWEISNVDYSCCDDPPLGIPLGEQIRTSQPSS